MQTYIPLLQSESRSDGQVTYLYDGKSRLSDECLGGDLVECQGCGAAVTDTDIHDDFHRMIGAIGL